MQATWAGVLDVVVRITIDSLKRLMKNSSGCSHQEQSGMGSQGSQEVKPFIG